MVPERTGFLEKDTFVTHSDIIGAAGRRKRRPLLPGTDDHLFVDVRGRAKKARVVLQLARRSTYLAFSFGVALAAPLPSYVKLLREGGRDKEALVTETAVFNFSGESSSGKSSACKAALSLVGSPDRAGTLDCSRRGLAEMAAHCNDLVLVLDDTENTEVDCGTIVKTIKSVVHMVPGGRSKAISRSVDEGRFPILRWSTFGLSSSPEPIPVLAAKHRWLMSLGDKVRLFDIGIPSSSRGGIFDLIRGTPEERAEQSVGLIKEMERGYQNHHGHAFLIWAPYLMSRDRSQAILNLVDEFVQHIGRPNQGWEVRFARKFGVIYAAMMLGVDAGLLPWPKTFPLAVVKKCYRKARNAAKTDSERARDALRKLDRLIKKHDFVDVPFGHWKPINIPQQTIALRYIKDGRPKLGILDAALLEILGSKKAKLAFTKSLAAAGILAGGHGHAGTPQERIPIVRNGQLIKRPRLWVLDIVRFRRHLTKALGQRRAERHCSWRTVSMHTGKANTSAHKVIV